MNRIEIDTKSQEYQIIINGVDMSNCITEIKLECNAMYPPTFEISNKANQITVPKLSLKAEDWKDNIPPC